MVAVPVVNCLADAPRLVADGEIAGAKSIIGLLLAERLLAGHEREAPP